jgi:hypothetical protein
MSSRQEVAMHLDKARPQIQTVTKTLEVGELLGKYESILPLLALYQSARGSEQEVLPHVAQLLKNFQKWASDKPWYPNISRQVEEIFNSLSAEMVKIK